MKLEHIGGSTMNILVLNGSPRRNGNTKRLIESFRAGAAAIGHEVTEVAVCRHKIGGCTACEACHGKTPGVCSIKDDMAIIYDAIPQTDMLVIASPIYYHNITGQLKCAIDRLYAVAYPKKPKRLRKMAIILSSGAPDVYEGALYSYKGDFLDYLGLENMGVFTAWGAENQSDAKLRELENFGHSLK